jgi:hypothetical protein
MPGQRYQEIRTPEHAMKFKDYKKNNMNTGRGKGRRNERKREVSILKPFKIFDHFQP